VPAGAPLQLGNGRPLATERQVDHRDARDLDISLCQRQRVASLACGQTAAVKTFVAVGQRGQHAGGHAQAAATVQRSAAPHWARAWPSGSARRRAAAISRAFEILRPGRWRP
jgi:hypothetical protein